MTVNSYTYKEGLGGPAESEYTQPTSQSDETKTFAEEMNDASKSNNTENTETKSTTEDKTAKTEETEEVDLWKIFEDIKSLMKTGLTKGEIEMLEKLKKALYDEASKKDPDEFKIEDLISAIEKLVAEFKKKVTGEAIIEAEDNPIRHSSSSLSTSSKDAASSTSGILRNNLSESQIQRLKDTLTDFENLISGKELKEIKLDNSVNYIPKNSSNDELELLNRIKNFQQ
jgi:hypothetical protein